MGTGGTVATNNGRKSARLASSQQAGKLIYTDADGDQDGLLQQPSSGNLASEGSCTLPPLTRSAKAVEALGVFGNDSITVGGAVSPAKRGRKQALAAYGDGTTKSLIQASLEVDVRERELALARENRKEYGRLLVEMWANQVLDPGGTDLLSPHTQPAHLDVTMLKGLAAFGLTRVELVGAGLNHAAVDRLYRGLYVYTIGFFDVMQDILEHSDFRVEILSNVWRAYLYIAESALKVAFKGEYLQLFQAQQITAAELLVAKEALAEATKDAHATEKALAWLSAAHAEERALRGAARQEAAAAAEALTHEQDAHQAAVARLVSEMEAKARLGIEVTALQEKLSQAAAAHATLVLQRDALASQRSNLEEKCAHVMSVVLELYTALTMESSLMQPPELQQAVTEAEALEQATPGLAQQFYSLTAKSSLVKALVSQLFDKWSKELKDHTLARRDLYAARDDVRAAKADLLEAQDARTAALTELETARKLTRLTETELEKTQTELQDTKIHLNEAKAALLLAHEDNARLQRHTDSLEQLLVESSQERDRLNETCAFQGQELAALQSALEATQAQLKQSQSVTRELSTGFAVTMQSLKANQTARQGLVRRLASTRAEVQELNRQLLASNRQNRLLEGKVEDLEFNNQDLSSRLIVVQQHAADNDVVVKQLTEQVAEQEDTISVLQLKLSESETACEKLKIDLQRTSTLLTSSEDSLKVEKEEVSRLYASMQELETALKQSGIERQRLAKKIEQAKSEVDVANENAKRRESTLNLEIKRLQSEVRLERSRISGFEMQLETVRKSVGESADKLARKRQKKRKWKQASQDMQVQLEHVRAQLGASYSGLEALEGRVKPLEVELAVLIADRGRPMPPSSSASAAVTLVNTASCNSSSNTEPQLARSLSSQQSPPSVSRSGSSRHGSNSNRASQSNMPRPAAVQQGLYEGTGDTPTITLLPPEIPGDMLQTYKQWDAANKEALGVQLQLDQHTKALEAARKQYERARAIYYTNPVDNNLKDRMIEKESELTKARSQRSELEAGLEATCKKIHTLQASIHQYEGTRAKTRMELLQARVGQQETSLRCEMSQRCDESDTRCQELSRLLEEQRTAYDMIMASRKHMEGECARIEGELRTLSDKLASTTADKLDVEEQLRQARNHVEYAQDETAALAKERDAMQGRIKELEEKQAQLRSEMETAAANVTARIKRAEQRIQEEKDAAVALLLRDKADATANIETQLEIIGQLSQAKQKLQDNLRATLLLHFNDMEFSPKPLFLHSVRPRPALLSAQALVPEFARPHAFRLDDPVVHFIAPSYETLLIIISQLYTNKLVVDAAQETVLLGGRVGQRCDLEPLIYDFFVSRYGTRPCAEMHLAAFIYSVQKYRAQHPKIRVLARFLGIDDPLPKPAVEFYCALLNRVHARAGPLVSEASDGAGRVKCRLVAKAARELLRGSYANINLDAASLSDTLRHLALNDEEQPIELDVALELALKAWWLQFNADVEALEVVMRGFSATSKDLTPDDVIAFLRHLDSAKVEETPQELIQTMYRTAIRTAGPTPTAAALRKALCTAIIEHGFTGMSGYQGRLEIMKSMPPYDEFLVLEESWRAMRPVVEQQLMVLDNHKELHADVPAYIEMARTLDLALERRENPAVPWILFRRLLVQYQHWRKHTDVVQPFEPPAAGAAANGLLSQADQSKEGDELDALNAAIREAEMNAQAAAEAQKLQQSTIGKATVTRRTSFVATMAYSFGRSRTSSQGGTSEPEDAKEATIERKGGLLRPRSPQQPD